MEILWSSVSDDNKLQLKNVIEELAQKFPLNLEFKHTLGHLELALKNKEQGLALYKICSEGWGNNYPEIIDQIFTLEIKQAEDLLFEDHYEKALSLASKMLSNKVYKDNSIFNNIIISFKQRIRDRQSLKTNFNDLQEQLKSEVESQISTEKRRVFELLAVFTAVIAFIISSVSLIGRVQPNVTAPLILSIGFILVLFVVTVSLMSDRPTNYRQDIRTYLLLGYLLGSLFLPYVYDKTCTVLEPIIVNQGVSQLDL